MKSISYTTANQNLTQIMDQVCDDHAPVAITRRDQDTVVMISLADYKAWAATAYLLRSPKNTTRLFDAIDELETGSNTRRELGQ